MIHEDRADTSPSLTDPFAFAECDTCAQRTGTPLCLGCQHNQAVIRQLRAEHTVLVEVYAIAACLRSFPVSLEKHLEWPRWTSAVPSSSPTSTITTLRSRKR